MEQRCAYCGLVGPLSREHVWPRGIIKRTPDYNARYFGKADKVLSAELVIKDVCSTCNNGILSSLDEYGCRLFDDYFHDPKIGTRPVNFRYNYDRLLRWLLKISYNASRSVGVDTEHLCRCVPYVVGTDDTIKDTWLFAMLVRPFERMVDGEHKVVPAYGIRATRVEPANKRPLPFVIRLVALNAFYFFIVLAKEGETANFSLAKQLLRCKQVPRTQPSVNLKPGGFDTRDVWAGHLLDKEDLYRSYFARKAREEG
jgi:hypothetical protein